MHYPGGEAMSVLLRRTVPLLLASMHLASSGMLQLGSVEWCPSQHALGVLPERRLPLKATAGVPVHGLVLRRRRGCIGDLVTLPDPMHPTPPLVPHVSSEVLDRAWTNSSS